MSTPTKPLPCPFCGAMPKIETGKLGHCSLHGEPYQAVVIKCKNHECPARPRVEDGNIYNFPKGTNTKEGLKKATQEATDQWNKRFVPCPEALEKDVMLIMLEALENLENDDGSIRAHAWKMIQDAVRLAGGKAKP